MSKSVILWQPIVPGGEKLICDDPELFVLQMSVAFVGESWPLLLTAKDIPMLRGMAAATTMIGNPYLSLVENLRKFPKIEIRREDLPF